LLDIVGVDVMLTNGRSRVPRTLTATVTSFSFDTPFGHEVEDRLCQRRILVRQSSARDPDVLPERLVLALDDVDRTEATRDVIGLGRHGDFAAEPGLEAVSVDTDVVTKHDLDAAPYPVGRRRLVVLLSSPTTRSSGEVETEAPRSFGAIFADGTAITPST
jgi:hypothetical protein